MASKLFIKNPNKLSSMLLITIMTFDFQGLVVSGPLHLANVV